MQVVNFIFGSMSSCKLLISLLFLFHVLFYFGLVAAITVEMFSLGFMELIKLLSSYCQ